MFLQMFWGSYFVSWLKLLCFDKQLKILNCQINQWSIQVSFMDFSKAFCVADVLSFEEVLKNVKIMHGACEMWSPGPICPGYCVN